jgi:hypothetical protein
MLSATSPRHYYTLICKKQPNQSGRISPLHIHRGCYGDIRDVMQAIINFSVRYSDVKLEFMIQCSDRKPIGWLCPTRYHEI